MAFDLRFETVEPVRGIRLDAPPTLTLSPPHAGWINWRIGEGDEAPLICMSDCYSPLVSLWVWAAAIAHGLTPVVLRIDEEGYYTDICARPGPHGDLELTVLQVDVNGEEWRSAVWREPARDWLSRFGETLGGYLGDTFDVQEWNLGLGLWPEPAQDLPWDWPSAVERNLAPYACDWPVPCQRAWFFMVLARRLDPFGLPGTWRPEIEETYARLRFLLARCRREAMEGALAVVGIDSQAPAAAALDRQFQAAQDLFEELEIWRETGSTDCPDLADPLALGRAFRQLFLSLESEMHSLARGATDALLPCLPIGAETWIANERGGTGHILCVDSPRIVIDWGEPGIGTECWPFYGCGTIWRWPIAAPGDVPFPNAPLFQRWRVFATTPTTAGHPVCPCCGYPHLAEDCDEIMDCPLCGWPLFLFVYHGLPDPTQPLFGDTTGDPETWPSLRESRRWFCEHGDAFPLEDQRRTAWLRRPDVAALRRFVIAGFDAWLEDPSSARSVLPEDDWQRLVWMPKGPEDALSQ